MWSSNGWASLDGARDSSGHCATLRVRFISLVIRARSQPIRRRRILPEAVSNENPGFRVEGDVSFRFGSLPSCHFA